MDRQHCKGRAHWHRKERVLHTRISERLDESLRRAADELRVPVSNLVRNVLEDAFMVVETVAENVGELVDDMLEEAERVRGQWRRRSRWESRFRHRTRTRDEPRAPEVDSQEPEEAPREFPDVVGWQPLILNADQTCAECDRALRRGDKAFVGLTAQGPSPYWLCRECLQDRA